jgi:hypothetical protein
MIKIQSYTHEDFFREIPDLENKTLLDLGAGPNCTFGMAYIDYVYNQLARTKEELDKEAYQRTEELKKKPITLNMLVIRIY